MMRPFHRWSRSIVVAALTSVCAVALTPAALAAPPTAKPDDDVKKRARTLFEEGAKAIQENRAEEGVAKLAEAESLFHAPTHLLYLARGQVSLKRFIDAKKTYEKLVSETLPASASRPFKDAQAAGATELVELDKRIPRIVLTVEPSTDGVKVTMNNVALDASRITSAPMEVDPGTYAFEARSDTLESGAVTVDVTEGSTTRVKLTLHALGQQPTPNAQPESGLSPLKLGGISLIAVGGAAVLGGGALGIMHFVTAADADDKFSTCGSSCRTEILELDEKAALYGNVAIGLLAGGAAVLATGVILFAVPSTSSSPDDASKPTAWLELSPSYVGVSGRF
ncbi:MAG: hypothetical protein U0271_39505 [Polyangiaceae bacterium]